MKVISFEKCLLLVIVYHTFLFTFNFITKALCRIILFILFGHFLYHFAYYRYYERNSAKKKKKHYFFVKRIFYVYYIILFCNQFSGERLF